MRLTGMQLAEVVCTWFPKKRIMDYNSALDIIVQHR